MTNRKALTLKAGDIVAKRGVRCVVVGIHFSELGSVKLMIRRLDGHFFVVDYLGHLSAVIEVDHKGWTLEEE